MLIFFYLTWNTSRLGQDGWVLRVYLLKTTRLNNYVFIFIFKVKIDVAQFISRHCQQATVAAKQKKIMMKCNKKWPNPFDFSNTNHSTKKKKLKKIKI